MRYNYFDGEISDSPLLLYVRSWAVSSWDECVTCFCQWWSGSISLNQSMCIYVRFLIYNTDNIFTDSLEM